MKGISKTARAHEAPFSREFCRKRERSKVRKSGKRDWQKEGNYFSVSLYRCLGLLRPTIASILRITYYNHYILSLLNTHQKPTSYY